MGWTCCSIGTIDWRTVRLGMSVAGCRVLIVVRVFTSISSRSPYTKYVVLVLLEKEAGKGYPVHYLGAGFRHARGKNVAMSQTIPPQCA